MKLGSDLTDTAILRELGARLERRRIDQNLTQAELADQAGVSKRTVERIEGGASTDFTLLVRTLRTLRLLDELNQLVPDLPESPMTLLKHKGGERKRVRRSRKPARHPPEGATGRGWKWGE
jgi:transcriptional regulator with XRE-family HTH domain